MNQNLQSEEVRGGPGPMFSSCWIIYHHVSSSCITLNVTQWLGSQSCVYKELPLLLSEDNRFPILNLTKLTLYSAGKSDIFQTHLDQTKKLGNVLSLQLYHANDDNFFVVVVFVGWSSLPPSWCCSWSSSWLNRPSVGRVTELIWFLHGKYFNITYHMSSRYIWPRRIILISIIIKITISRLI